MAKKKDAKEKEIREALDWLRSIEGLDPGTNALFTQHIKQVIDNLHRESEVEQKRQHGEPEVNPFKILARGTSKSE